MPFIEEIDFKRTDILKKLLKKERISTKAWGIITVALAEVREITERETREKHS